jgi:hypothetical protein
MKLLTSFVVTFVDALYLYDNKELALKLLTNQGDIQVKFIGIIHLNMSNDLLDLDDDEITVVDVSHEFRELDNYDKEQYLFELSNSPSDKNIFHIVKIHGSTIIQVICEDVIVNKV